MRKRPALIIAVIVIQTHFCMFTSGFAAEPASVEDFPAVLDLEAALEFAWEHHPVMKEMQMRVGAAHGARVQAGLWPRPDISFSRREELGVETATSIGVSQKFELGGKRGARIAVADAETLVRDAEMLARWLDVRGDVKRSFAMAAFAGKAVEIAREAALKHTEAERLAESLFAAGRMAEADYVAVKKEAAESAVQFRAASLKNIDARRQALLAVGAGKSSLYDRVSADLKDCRVALPSENFEELRDIALANNPDLIKAKGVLQTARAMERLARAKRWCDLNIGIDRVEKTVSGENGFTDSATGVAISLDLPLWDRGQGRISEARSNYGAAQEAAASVEIKAESALSEFLADVFATSQEEKAYVEEIVPLAEKRSKLTKDLVDAGKLSGREYLDVESSLLNVRLKCLQVELASVLASIELERILAAPGQDQ